MNPWAIVTVSLRNTCGTQTKGIIMAVHNLRPWSDLVRLHPDVESGAKGRDIFALDFGGLLENDTKVAAVYQDAHAFFGATHLTTGMRRLLEEAAARLAGGEGDRVLQLQSPFGGGKSHVLAALYHAATNPEALRSSPDLKGLEIPEGVRVAGFDGGKLDAATGKEVAKGVRVRTLWGLLAWRMDETGALYELVREQDERRVAPGGDVVAKLLTGAPTLILLDEVLRYVERAMGERVEDSTLGRQTLEFIQTLTNEVAGSETAVMVYSLQASGREALQNVGLLETLDHLTSRVDAKREPVPLAEVLPVLHRRLLAQPPDPNDAASVADAYEQTITRTRSAHAEAEGERELVQEEGVKLRARFREAFPFHPALVELMTERWASISDFERTRGALRFLSACLHSLRHSNAAGLTLGPGDIPLHEADVRLAFFTEVGQREAFSPVVTADLVGANARAKRIDARMAQQNPALGSVRPATRLATAVLMYSFGGLTKEGEGEETLPPGVTEAELLAACVGPDLDNITAQACLKELREQCLFLHYDGTRYCFKTTPNINKLIEDEAEEISRSAALVRERTKELLEKRLALHRNVWLWQTDPPDKEPQLLVAYLPLEFAEKKQKDQEDEALTTLTVHNERPRSYRNGLALAIPSRAQLEPLRRAVRYVIALERVHKKRGQLGIAGKEQLDQLKERTATEEAAVESALRQLYGAVWMLKQEEQGGLALHKVEPGGKPLQATGVHERVMELLTTTHRLVWPTFNARKLVERIGLGIPIPGETTPRLGMATQEIVDAFFSFVGYPRVADEAVLRRSIADGAREGVFGYCNGPEPSLGEDGTYQVSRDRVICHQPVREEEIDLETGFLIYPSAIPLPPEPPPVEPPPVGPPGTPPEPPVTPPAPPVHPPGVRDKPAPTIRVEFKADRQQLFHAWQAIANLADKAGILEVQVEASSAEGFDPVWLRNAVEEPLEEAEIEASVEPSRGG
jgi:hypothetical protein